MLRSMLVVQLRAGKALKTGELNNMYRYLEAQSGFVSHAAFALPSRVWYKRSVQLS